MSIHSRLDKELTIVKIEATRKSGYKAEIWIYDEKGKCIDKYIDDENGECIDVI